MPCRADRMRRRLQLVHRHGEPFITRWDIRRALAESGLPPLLVARGLGAKDCLHAVSLDRHDPPAPRDVPKTQAVFRTVVAFPIEQGGDSPLAPKARERPSKIRPGNLQP